MDVQHPARQRRTQRWRRPLASLLIWGSLAGLALADEQGPATVIIRSTQDGESVSRPAILPHRDHQWLDCDGCHHQNDDQSLVVAPCESCHNKGKTMPTEVATVKQAGHARCYSCHFDNDPDLTRCSVCHLAPGLAPESSTTKE